MDSTQFDALTRALVTPGSRRRLLGSMVAGALGLAGLRTADARTCTAGGTICREHATCCSSNCLPKDRTGRRSCAECRSSAHCPPATDACHLAECLLDGQCGVTVAVQPGFALCGDVCVSTASDPTNCSGCGTVCPSDACTAPTCSGGVCGTTPINENGPCAGAPANATATCTSGICKVACNSGYTSDGNDGCTLICDPTTCIVPANSTANCTSGRCGFTCNSGYASDGNGGCAAFNGVRTICGCTTGDFVQCLPYDENGTLTPEGEACIEACQAKGGAYDSIGYTDDGNVLNCVQ